MSSQLAFIKQLIRGYLLWSPLWIGTTLVMGGVGFVYAYLMKKDVWLATQALLVRDEATSAIMRLGRFENADAMKAAQETIMEMAHNPQVVHEAMKAVGPQANWLGVAPNADDYPSAADVEGFSRDNLKLHGPSGAEFGSTEVIYLDVKHDSKEQAIKLNQALCDALERRMQQVRGARADGVIAELNKSRAIAREELRRATDALQLIENDIGTDLSELRGLTDALSGAGSGRQQLDQLANERRQAELALQQLEQDIAMLDQLEQDPSRALAAPSSLLNSQPGLKRLREGLVDAQIQASQLAGRYTDDHPAVIAANKAANRIIQKLGSDLKASKAGLMQDLSLARDRLAKIDAQENDMRNRIQRLAVVRADYANAVSEVKSRTAIVEQVERDLANAEASRSAAKSTSVIVRLDPPTLGDKPIGPGRSLIVAASAAVGLFMGVGIVLLLIPIDRGVSYGRRWSDMVGMGRRATDAPTGAARPGVVPVAPVPVGMAGANSQPVVTPVGRRESDRAAFQPVLVAETPFSETRSQPVPLDMPKPIPAAVEEIFQRSISPSPMGTVFNLESRFEELADSLPKFSEVANALPSTVGVAERRTKPRPTPAAIFGNES